MELGDVVVIGAVGVGAWWLYRRHRAMTEPIAQGNPAAAAGMTQAGAAASVTGGQPLVRSIVSSVNFTGLAGARLPAGPSGAQLTSYAKMLTALDNNPVPAPPAEAGPVQFSTTPGGAVVQGTGASTMGTNPSPLTKSFTWGIGG